MLSAKEKKIQKEDEVRKLGEFSPRALELLVRAGVQC